MIYLDEAPPSEAFVSGLAATIVLALELIKFSTKTNLHLSCSKIGETSAFEMTL